MLSRGPLGSPVPLAIPSRREYTAVIHHPIGSDSFSVRIFRRNAGTTALIAAFSLPSSIFAASTIAKLPPAGLGAAQQSSTADPGTPTAKSASQALPQECLRPVKITAPM